MGCDIHGVWQARKNGEWQDVPSTLSHAEHQRELEERRRREECQCDMRTKLVGDGCWVCNPELWQDLIRSDPGYQSWSESYDKETQKRQDEENK
jgi:hypothetical protein